MCGVQPVIEAAKVEVAVSAPLRSVQAEVPRTSWTLCARTMCSSQLEVIS